MTDSPRSPLLALVPHAVAFAVGALLAGYVSLSAWSLAYMRANPSTGSVSGGGGPVFALLFVAGVTVMFLAWGSARARL